MKLNARGSDCKADDFLLVKYQSGYQISLFNSTHKVDLGPEEQ